ncbi:MAG: ABC transporter permease [Deltaproteobacteria bacterium]|nr:ABC transporter permease [Deltaproteobacteria bacterium]
MSAYLLKRLLTMIPTLFGIMLITFLIVRLAPGNPVSLKIQAAQGLKSTALSQEVTDQMLKLYGLKVDLPAGYENFIKDKPAPVRKALEWLGQNTIQFKIWLVNVCQLNFGMSFKDHRPVLEKIREALPITLTLNLLEFLIAYLISIPLGVYSALGRESAVDKGVMVLLFILYSLPTFWVAYLLLMYFASGDHLNWFPLGGLHSEGYETYPFLMKIGNLMWHLVLPVITMVYGSFAFITRFSRSTMLEVVKQDYVRTAWAKGLPRRQVIWKHAFRNSLIPQITLLGTLLPALLGGSVIIEQIFSIPGMGKLAFEAISSRDYPTIMAITTISAFLTLISLLLSDIAYAFADPRISFEEKQQA